jgi:EAL domain-containing protein (putative c-di-GMP-specific phosphodiesterase class I)
LGGDEFCVLLAEIAHPEDAARVGTKVLEAVARPVRLEDRDVVTTASVGIAVFPQDGAERQALMVQADASMYVAKRGGGHRVASAGTKLARDWSSRLELESDLREALPRGQLRLEFQPFVDLRSGGSLGFEALVRWEHPRRGVLAPLDFLPVAEDIGMMEAIDAWVLAEACRQAPTLSRIDGGAAVAVNLSPAGLVARGFPDAVGGALDRSGLRPRRLVLEISEQTVLDDREGEVLGCVRALRGLGVTLALDDFGAGRTSLGQLHELPIDLLKVDRRFVARMGDDRGSTAIMAAMIALAHTLGMGVIAEGVERPDQATRLRELGCDAAQGYLFSRPRPAGELTGPFTSS